MNTNGETTMVIFKSVANIELKGELLKEPLEDIYIFECFLLNVDVVILKRVYPNINAFIQNVCTTYDSIQYFQ